MSSTTAQRRSSQMAITSCPPSPARRPDLDALRGAVMLLGIALHAALPFFAGIWPVPEPSASTGGYFDEFVQAVHGFRMQVFFVLSGFFTAMLLHRRGLRALVAHRTQRVLVPLLVGVVTVVPLIELAAAGAMLPEGGFSGVGTGAPTNTEWFTPRQNLHHLWFLWFLCLYLAVFALARAALQAVRRTLIRRWVPSRRVRLAGLAALVALPVLPQSVMVGHGDERTFGPTLPNLVLPDRAALIYYAAFFVFGLTLWAGGSRSGHSRVEALGRRWPVILAISLLVVFPLARLATWSDPDGPRLAAAVLQVAFAWGMVVALIGLFRRLFRTERQWVSYLADASYWIYLIHLPLLIAVHRLIHPWDAPALAKFTLLCVLVTAILLATYQAFIRHTLIGRVLHGPRSRRSVPDRCPRG